MRVHYCLSISEEALVRLLIDDAISLAHVLFYDKNWVVIIQNVSADEF